jgi:excisionase family DNA binding protein
VWATRIRGDLLLLNIVSLSARSFPLNQFCTALEIRAMSMKELTKDAYEVLEIAEMLSVSDKTVRNWINTLKLNSHKFPGSGEQMIIRVLRADLEDFLKTYQVHA